MKTICLSAISALFLLISATSHAETVPVSAPKQTDYLNSVKITFLSWISGSTKISYERAFPKVRQSGEICGSLICAGYDKYHNNPLGFTVRYGHKFFLAGNEGGGLKGFYVRPELIYATYKYNLRDTGLRTQARMGTLLATAGYQTRFGRFLIDAWAGAGPAFGTPAETGYHHGFALWNVFGTRSDHIALSFSVRLGVCF